MPIRALQGFLVVFTSLLGLAAVCPAFSQERPSPPLCAPGNTVTANVVALEQTYYYNRTGSFNPAGLIYALRRDVNDEDGKPIDPFFAHNPSPAEVREKYAGKVELPFGQAAPAARAARQRR